MTHNEWDLKNDWLNLILHHQTDGGYFIFVTPQKITKFAYFYIKDSTLLPTHHLHHIQIFYISNKHNEKSKALLRRLENGKA